MGTNSNSSPSPQGQSSVPIFLYRQLAQELEAVKQENSHLAQENQRLSTAHESLKTEAMATIAAMVGLQELLAQEKSPISNNQQQIESGGFQSVAPESITSSGVVPQLAASEETSQSELIEEIPLAEEVDNHNVPRGNKNENPRGAGLTQLVTIISFALVIISAFVAGFMFIPPLLNQNSNSN